MQEQSHTGNNPIISVVIPAHNEEKFLSACLASLEQQDFSGIYEIIVVDNASTDKTADVAKKFGAIVVYEPRKGVCFARQRGVEAATGKIIISTDADCVLPKNWIQNYVQAFRSERALVAASGPFVFGPIPKWGQLYSRLLFYIVNYFYKRSGKIKYVGASNFAFLKSSWEKIGGYNTGLAQGGDELDLFKRLHKQGKAVYLHDNKIQTSSRRLKKGFVYSVVVSLFFYYVLDYSIATFITGRSLFGHYPAMREHVQKPSLFARFWHGTLYTLIILLLVLVLPSVNAKEAYAKARVFHHTRQFSYTMKHKMGSLVAKADTRLDSDDK